MFDAMKNLRLFLAVLCLLSMLSCGETRQEERLLEDIERTWQLCETSLTEAGMRCEAMKDSVQEATEYARQKYDLLCIRLRDKCDIVPSSPDSAKRTAAYFEGRESALDRERAYYYLASAYRDLRDYPRAVTFFLKAADAAEQGGEGADTLIWQNSLSQLRHLHMLMLNYEEELNVAKQAVELAMTSSEAQAGRRKTAPSAGNHTGYTSGTDRGGRNMARYLMDVAAAYKHLGDTLQCLHHCDLAYKAMEREQFPEGQADAMAYMLSIYSQFGRQEKAGPLLRRLSLMAEDRRPHNYELCLARFFEDSHLTDSATAHYIIYYSKATDAAGRYEAAAGMQRCMMRRGDFRQAAFWGQRLYETNDSIVAQRTFEQTQRAQDVYRYHRDVEAERDIMQRGERIRLFAVISGLALLSIVLGLAAFYSFRKKRFIEEIVGWKKLLEEKALINKELTRIALMHNAEDKAEATVEHFHNIAAGLSRPEMASWKELTAAIDTLYPGFLEEIERRESKPVREPLLRTICLMKIGLRPAEIARVMDAAIQTVWNRVKRAEELCGDLLASPGNA